MKTHYIIILILGITVACTPHKNKTYDLIIANVNLIDGTGVPIKNNVNVYLDGERIDKIDSVKVNLAGDNIIDGSGKYLIPGLFDCHVHTGNYKADFQKFIHFGVTSIFVTGGSITTNEYYAEMRALGEQDSLPAPHVYHTSQHFTMEGRHPVKTYATSNWVEGETVFYLRDTLQIEALVKQVSLYPILGIKLTIEEGPAPPFVERIPQAFVDKVQKEAMKNNIRVFAHVSDNTEFRMALKAGISDIIHFTGVDLDFENGQALVDSIYQSNLSWVTTLMIDKSFMYPLYLDWVEQVEQMDIFNDDEVKMLRDSTSINNANQYLTMLENYFGIENPNLENIIIPQVEEIKILFENGVNMVLGTDTGNTFIFPGYSLHEEMQLMELGGMQPIDIIKMGTHNAAKMMDVLDTHGTIEPGKYADMILLDENPLETISNTLTINKVFKNGKVQKRMIKSTIK